MATRTCLLILSLLVSTADGARERRSQAKQLAESLAELVRPTQVPTPQKSPALAAVEESSVTAANSSDADLAQLATDIRGMFTFNGQQAPPDAPPDASSMEEGAEVLAAAAQAPQAIALPQQTAKSPVKPAPPKAVPPVSTSPAVNAVATAPAVPTAKPAVEAKAPSNSTSAKATHEEHAQKETVKDSKLPSQALASVKLAKAEEELPVLAHNASAVEVAQEHNSSGEPTPAKVHNVSSETVESKVHSAKATQQPKDGNSTSLTEKVVEALPMAKLALGEDISEEESKANSSHKSSAASQSPAPNASAAAGKPHAAEALSSGNATETPSHTSIHASTSVVSSNTSVVESAPVANTSSIARFTALKPAQGQSESGAANLTAASAAEAENARLKHEHELEAEVARLKEKLAMQTSARQATASKAVAASDSNATATAAIPSTTHAASLVAKASAAHDAPAELPRFDFEEAMESEAPVRPKVSLRETLRRPQESEAQQPPHPARHFARPSRHVPRTRSVEDSVASLPLSGLVTLDSAVAASSEKEPLPESAPAEPRSQSPPAAQPPAAPTVQPVPTQPPHLGWFWSFVNWLTGGSSSSATQAAAAPAEGKPPASSSSTVDGQLALLTSSVPKQREAETRETMRQTRSDGQRVISISEPWGRMAHEDAYQEARIRSEDNTLRVEALHTPPPRHDPAAATLHGGSRVSGFWGTLEKEDADREDSLQDEKDLTRYQRLTQLQDEQVTNAVSQLAQEPPSSPSHPLRGQDTSFGSTNIHEAWANLEAKDVSQEKKVHADPQLRMLQEKAHHQLRHPNGGARS